MKDLNEIGFYTLSDYRAKQSSNKSPLWRCELILTGRCNFKCPYCRSVGGQDLAYEQAEKTVRLWASQGCKNIRFSGGEPTMYKKLPELVSLAKSLGVERIAISTNGASSLDLYDDLLNRGVNDFSISLDAYRAEDGDRMAGGRKGAWYRVVEAITYLSSKTYVTVGVVLTSDNKESAEEIVKFAHSLGVSDIRVIPAAQEGEALPVLNVSDEVADKYPIMKYRLGNISSGVAVRGVSAKMTNKCGLVLDDMAVMGDKHYPCIIYLRENGQPIGTVGENMRQERLEWYEAHDSFNDEICSKNCLDVCCDYNRKHEEFHK